MAKLELEDLDLILREDFSGIDMCSALSGAVRTTCNIEVDGNLRPVRPKMMWKKLTE